MLEDGQNFRNNQVFTQNLSSGLRSLTCCRLCRYQHVRQSLAYVQVLFESKGGKMLKIGQNSEKLKMLSLIAVFVCFKNIFIKFT